MDLSKRCMVEFSDGNTLHFYGHVEPADEAGAPTVDEDGRITEPARAAKLVIVKDGVMSYNGQVHAPVEPGDYLVTEDGLFKRL